MFFPIDIAEILNYKNPDQAVTTYCKDSIYICDLLHYHPLSSIGSKTKLCYQKDIENLLDKNRTKVKEFKQGLRKFLKSNNLFKNETYRKKQIIDTLNKTLFPFRTKAKYNCYVDELELVVPGYIESHYLVIDINKKLDKDDIETLGFEYININSKFNINFSIGMIIKKLLK
jgi:hypothetical protein